MILEAKHNRIAYFLISIYLRWKIRKTFKPVEIINWCTPKKLPVLLLANHTSWWDGFWIGYTHMLAFNKKFHFMMLEEQLRKYWLFNYIGGFSVSRGSRSVVETLNYTADLLSNNENLVLIFPQGKIHSVHNPDFVFEKGAEKILKRVHNPVQVVFMACLTDYFSNAKPGLYIYLKEYEITNYSTDALQAEYNRFYRSCIENQEKLAK